MVAPPPAQRLTMREAADAFAVACLRREGTNSLASTTSANYVRDVEDLVALIGADVIVDDVTGEDVEMALVRFQRLPDRRFREERAGRSQGKSVQTQARFRRSITQFFAHADKSGWVQLSPMVFVENRDKSSKSRIRAERRSLEPPQAEALLSYGPGDPREQDVLRPHERNYARDAYMLTLMLVLGPRVSEMVNANRDDFAFTGSATVWDVVGKGGKPRRLPLSPELVQLREEYRRVRPAPSPLLPLAVQKDALRAEFLTGRGNRMTARDVQRMVHRAHERVAVVDPELARGVTPHALRHTAATLLLANGWDVKVVRDLLGHSSIATTSLYLDEINDELAQAVRAHPLLRSVPDPAVSVPG